MSFPHTATAQRLSLVSNELPEPPYPEATKANGFKQEVDWDRISQSRTWIYADNEVRPWLLMLWLKSWQNVPAGTWEADDEYIARSLGCKLEFFIGHREQFMRGWVRHADGRLYHPFITAQVLEMLGRRRATANRVKEHRQKNQAVAKTGSTEETQCNALHSVTYAKEQEQEQEQEISTTKVSVNVEAKTAKAARGARLQLLALPDDWKAWAIKERPDLNADTTWQTFRDYWVAIPGQKGCKSDWLATWRNWVRNQRSSPKSIASGEQHGNRRETSAERFDRLNRLSIEELYGQQPGRSVERVVVGEVL